MSAESFYRDHWLDVDPERLDVYEEMFRWRAEMEPMLAPAAIEPGHRVVDYGCGPGMLSLELARRVGPEGQGRTAPILMNMARYARESGKVDAAEVDAILDDAKAAIDAGSYLLVIPQFLVTAAAD